MSSAARLIKRHVRGWKIRKSLRTGAFEQSVDISTDSTSQSQSTVARQPVRGVLYWKLQVTHIGMSTAYRRVEAEIGSQNRRNDSVGKLLHFKACAGTELSRGNSEFLSGMVLATGLVRLFCG